MRSRPSGKPFSSLEVGQGQTTGELKVRHFLERFPSPCPFKSRLFTKLTDLLPESAISTFGAPDRLAISQRNDIDCNPVVVKGFAAPGVRDNSAGCRAALGEKCVLRFEVPEGARDQKVNTLASAEFDEMLDPAPHLGMEVCETATVDHTPPRVMR